MYKLTKPEELDELVMVRKSYIGTPSAQEAWSNFGASGGRTKVRKQLENVQNDLCAYCENTLADNGHIDHFKPKSLDWKVTFEWENLVVSCSHNDSCGNKKGKSFQNYWINPYLDNPKGEFIFYSDGQIKGNSLDAENIIKDFGLDCPRLEKKRKGILTTLELNISSLIEFPDALEAYLKSEEGSIFPTGCKQIIERTMG